MYVDDRCLKRSTLNRNYIDRISSYIQMHSGYNFFLDFFFSNLFPFDGIQEREQGSNFAFHIPSDRMSPAHLEKY